MPLLLCIEVSFFYPLTASHTHTTTAKEKKRKKKTYINHPIKRKHNMSIANMIVDPDLPPVTGPVAIHTTILGACLLLLLPVDAIFGGFLWFSFRSFWFWRRICRRI